MVAFLARSDLSRGDLRLFLSNGEGYSQDAFRVRWTVYSAVGAAVSGRGLSAIRSAVGEYYAPWKVKAVNGNYRIEWEVETDPGSSLETFTEKFFVIEPSAYQCCPTFVCDNGQPLPGGFAYLIGSQLGPGDLPLFLKNEDGFPFSAFAVFWTIFDSHGCPVTPRTVAVSAATGEYYAPWFVNALGGEYTIRWEFMQDADSPLEAAVMSFSVISPPAFICFANSSCSFISSDCSFCSPCIVPFSFFSKSCGGGFAPTCGTPCSPCNFSVPSVPMAPVTSQCCDFEIARVVHLSTQFLMAGGAFTNQPVYQIPAKIRMITFYISYTRGAAGGYPALRLLWGNGTEETQSTLINSDFITLSSLRSQQEMFLEDLKGPVPDSNDIIGFTIETTVPGGATTVRLLAAEGGVIGAPGTIGITLTAAS